RNGLTAHRFALRALPSVASAPALDLRGEIDGGDWRDSASWSGRLYAAFDYVDLAAWGPWLDLPPAIGSGKGAARLWLGLADKHVTELTADLAMADLSTRLSRDLPVLRLVSLQGRLSIKAADGGFDASGKRLALRTEEGIAVGPTDFALRWEPSPMRAE